MNNTTRNPPSPIIKDDEEFYQFNGSPILLRASAFAANLLLVCGTFSNLIAIGVLSSTTFKRMSSKTHVKIICCLNMCVLLLQSVRHHTFVMDPVLWVPAERRRYLCTFLLWYVLVFDKVMPFCISLAIMNRIKCQRKPDKYEKEVDAFRSPVVLNTIALLTCSVPVSLYIEKLDAYTFHHNHTECTFPYIHAYPRAVREGNFVISTMDNMPIIELGLILVLLLILAVEVANRVRRSRTKVKGGEDDSISSLTDLSASVIVGHSITNTMSRMGVAKKQGPDRNIGNRAAGIQRISTDSENTSVESSEPISIGTVLERDAAMTKLIVVIAILYLLTGLPRHMIKSTFFGETIFKKAHRSIGLRLFLDLIFYIYLAAAFPIFYASSKLFRSEANLMLFEAHCSDSGEHSDLSLASTLTMRATKIFSFDQSAIKLPGATGETGQPVKLKDNDTKKVLVEDFDLSNEALRVEAIDELHMQASYPNTIAPSMADSSSQAGSGFLRFDSTSS